MKNTITLIQITLGALLAFSCEFKYPEVHVLPDPVFQETGLRKFSTVSIYKETDLELSITRTHGLSREMELTIQADENLIADYNDLNTTSFSAMPSGFYRMPSSVKFAPDTKEVKVSIRVETERLVGEVGLSDANNMIIPVRITGSSIESEQAEAMGNVLVNLSISSPTVNVDVPQQASLLEFIPTIPLPQTLSLHATANFTTLDVEKLHFEAAPEQVSAFNEANGTDYQLLPAGKYSFGNKAFDDDEKRFSSDAVFDCSSIGGTDTYVLPIILESGDYVVEQAEPIYVLVSMSELRVWPAAAGGLIQITSGTGSIEILMNSPMTEVQNINLKYVPGKIAEYNAANGTSFMTLDASKVQITSSSIPAGEKAGNVGYSIDFSDIEYDAAEKYLVPMSIDQSVLVPGTVTPADPTVYLVVNKTLTGVYTVELIKSVFKARDQSKDFQNVIYLADGNTPAGPEGKQKIVNPSPEGQKYAVYYNKYLHVYFDISTEESATHPGCRDLINLRDREQGYDAINYNASYFNPATGDFVFDFITLGWWGPGGGGGAGLDNPDDLPGELWCAKLSDRQ